MMIDGTRAELIRGALEIAARNCAEADRALSDVEMLHRVESALQMLTIARDRLAEAIDRDALGNWKRSPVARVRPRGTSSR